jgi:hypothetical protein
MPRLPGFVGPSYTSKASNANNQRCVNLYLEADESGSGRSDKTLYQTPGIRTFTTLGGLSVTSAIEIEAGASSGRAFAVSGTQFYEIFADGSNVGRGVIVEDAGRTYLVASNVQVLINSAGKLYCFTLSTNAFAEVSTDDTGKLAGPVAMIDYSDGYFFALLRDTQSFQISALFDGNTWNPLDIGVVSYYPDNVRALKVDHREPWLFGSKATVPYYDSGNPDFPYDPIPGTFIEQGIASAASLTKFDNTLFWISQDALGDGMAWRADGYTPKRVSNFGVENEWRTYSTISDVTGYAYQENGHIFWVLYFPTANKTWVYDASNGTWHERESLLNGLPGAHFSRCHVFAFGKHLVGDWNSGNIYEMSLDIKDDNGQPRRWLRRSPHYAKENEYIYPKSLEFIVQNGVGPMPPLYDGEGNPRGPQVMIRFSKDGGRTWSNEYMRSVGQAGEFLARVRKEKLGRGRDWVCELSGSDPVDIPIIDALVEF